MSNNCKKCGFANESGSFFCESCGEKMPDDFGTADGVMKSGLADIILSSRNELKEIVTKLTNIILKKGELLEQGNRSEENFDKSIEENIQKTSEAI